MKTNEKALNAFLTAKAKFDEGLKRLQELSDNHFGMIPEEITWEVTEDMKYYAAAIKELTDQPFNEGEYTK